MSVIFAISFPPCAVRLLHQQSLKVRNHEIHQDWCMIVRPDQHVRWFYVSMEYGAFRETQITNKVRAVHDGEGLG